MNCYVQIKTWYCLPFINTCDMIFRKTELNNNIEFNGIMAKTIAESYQGRVRLETNDWERNMIFHSYKNTTFNFFSTCIWYRPYFKNPCCIFAFWWMIILRRVLVGTIWSRCFYSQPFIGVFMTSLLDALHILTINMTISEWVWNVNYWNWNTSMRMQIVINRSA